MTFYKSRHHFANLSLKIGTIFSRFGLSPNQWTMVSIIPALIALYYLINSEFLLAALFFLLSAFLDLVDGSVARVMGKVTKRGAYLDTVVDRYVEALIVLGLVFIALPDFYIPAAAWIFIYFLGSMMTTYVKSAAKEKELVEKEIKGGILERAERLVILFIGILLAILDRSYLTYTIALLAVLANISALQRIGIAVRDEKKSR